MNGQRRGYVIALVMAVLALVVSVGAAVGVVTRGGAWERADETRSGPGGWRQGAPGEGMMGNGRVGWGMMGEWGDADSPRVSPDAARAAADTWVAANQPGATVGAGTQMPMGYLFTVTEDGRTVGTIIVNDDTGQVAWWGGPQPSPTASSS